MQQVVWAWDYSLVGIQCARAVHACATARIRDGSSTLYFSMAIRYCCDMCRTNAPANRKELAALATTNNLGFFRSGSVYSFTRDDVWAVIITDVLTRLRDDAGLRAQVRRGSSCCCRWLHAVSICTR
jgi:hypothetical protein